MRWRTNLLHRSVHEAESLGLPDHGSRNKVRLYQLQQRGVQVFGPVPGVVRQHVQQQVLAEGGSDNCSRRMHKSKQFNNITRPGGLFSRECIPYLQVWDTGMGVTRSFFDRAILGYFSPQGYLYIMPLAVKLMPLHQGGPAMTILSYHSNAQGIGRIVSTVK